MAAFYTRESLNKQLSDPTTDATPWSLNRRAQLSSAAGDTHGALDLLLKSYELDAANADTRYLLVETILTGMEEDFEKYQELARKFDKIIEYGPQRFRFLQQLTLGNIRSNQHLAAFSRLLDLVNDRVGSRFKMSQNRANQVAISENHQVDSDAWIISNLARSYAAASEEERAEIERLVALELADIDQWVLSIRHQKLRFFSWLPAAEPQLLLLAESLMSDQEWVSAEQVLVPLLASANAETVAAARQLLSRESSWDRKLLGYYGQYGSLIPDPTQRNPLDRLRSEMPQIELEPEPWNRGLALVSMNRESNYAEGMVVEQLSNRFGRPEVELRIVSEKLLIYSQNGQQVGRIRYDRATNDISDLSVKASVRGSLVVVNTHSEIVAFNLYAGLERDTDAMLWRQSLFGAGPTIRYEPRAAENVISDLGFPLDTRSNQSGQAVSVGPITVSGVPIQTGSKVMMLDGQSGRMVWSRDGFNRQVEFATLDSRLAILTYHADRTDVEIVDCRDGTTLAERKVPGGWTHWYSFNGLSVDFVQRFDGSGAGFEIPHTLRIWNPLDGEELLRLKLAAGARAEQCSQRHIAVLEPDGKMHLIDLADPSKAIHREHQVPVLGVLDTISLQKVGEQLVLLSNASGDRETSRDPLLFARGDSLRDRVPINGFVYGIDRDTLDLSWDRPGELYSFAFPTNQPRNSPFMALYRVRKLESTAELLLIDTRTGKLAYSSGAFLTRTPSGFTMTLNPFNQSLAIELGARLFKVEFTRMGRPPQPIVVSSLVHPKGS